MLSTLKQPKPFYLIFFIELWERFGYYGMFSLIVFYFIKGLGFTDKDADLLFGTFAALTLIFPAIGGYIGDKVFGTKRTIIFGTVVLIIGYTLLALPLAIGINIPLAIIAVGAGLFKPNPSSLLAKIYQKDHSKIDSGFTLYYMAVNIGALLSISTTPYLSHIYGWHIAFGICAIGLMIALVTYLGFSNLVRSFGSPADFKPLSKRALWKTIGVVIGLIALSIGLLHFYTFSAWVIILGGACIFAKFIFEIIRSKAGEKKPLILCTILMLQSVVFFVLYFQMHTSVNLFALRNVSDTVFGIPIQAASYQALDAFWIMVLSPLFAMGYHWLSARDSNPSMPAKFALGTLMTGIAFLVLPFASTYYSASGIIPNGWLVLFYFLQTIGELLVSALGLAMISMLVPERLMGFVMGLWFFSLSIASIIAGRVASLSSIPKQITDPSESLPIYSHLFLTIGITAIGISLIMFVFVPVLNKLSNTSKSNI